MRAIIWAAVSTKGQASEDKGSISAQLNEARALCQKREWVIVDELIVPGFSRNYVDIHEFASEAAKEGIDAGKRLLQHFRDKDYDVFVVRDGDRFGRTQTMFSHVVETTVKIVGGQVYTFSDGMINDSNLRMGIAMGGYRVAGEIDGLREKQQIGYRAKIEQGLPMNASVARSHTIVRDPQSGKAVGVEVDENRRQEFLDFATLILEGVAWRHMEREMYRRFGYARDNGKPHSQNTYYQLIHAPSLWGHVAIGTRNTTCGKWRREAGYNVPEGVTINYDVFEPMYTGELALRIKAELDRREASHGKHSPHRTGMFSNLLMCKECSYALSYARSGRYRGLRCNSRYYYGGNRMQCTNTRYVNEKTVISDAKRLLEDIIEAGGIQPYLNRVDNNQVQTTLENVNRQMADLRQRIETMIHKQATAGSHVHDIYAQQIKQAGEQLHILTMRQQALKQDMVANTSASLKQAQAIADIESLGDAFWSMPSRKVNQRLHAIFGDYRMVYDRKTYQGVAKSPFV